MCPTELLERLGGYRFVATKLKRNPSSVFRWQTTGNPTAVWPALTRLCKRQGIELTVDDLVPPPRRKRQQQQQKEPQAHRVS